MDEYLLYLYIQYCESIGKKPIFDSINNDLNDFAMWIKRNKDISNYFKTYIEYLGIELNSEFTVEANKGKYDSIYNGVILIISPYAESMGFEASRIHDHHGDVVIGYNSSLYETDNIATFITHNPYDENHLIGFKSLYDIGKTICIGVFEKIDDKDTEQKLNMLKKYQELLGNARLEYDTIDDNYLCALKSDNKVYKKIYMK